MKSAAIVVVFFGVSAVADAPMRLQELAAETSQSAVCACEFSEMPRNWDFAEYRYRLPLVVLDVNGKPPRAHINVGGDDLLLRPQTEISFPLFECKPEEQFKTTWLADDLRLVVDLDVQKAGYEACWFYGLASLHDDDLIDVRPVIGACGC